MIAGGSVESKRRRLWSLRSTVQARVWTFWNWRPCEPNAPQSLYQRYHYLSWIVSGKRLAVGSGSARSPSPFLKGEQLSGPCNISLELRETTEHDMLS